jgi:hypothetical protein
MGICNKYNRKIRWTAVLLLFVVVMSGCAGMKPYEPRNNREEGPAKGLFTGSQGEWVILGPKAETTDAEEKKHPQNPADDAQ